MKVFLIRFSSFSTFKSELNGDYCHNFIKYNFKIKMENIFIKDNNTIIWTEIAQVFIVKSNRNEVECFL